MKCVAFIITFDVHKKSEEEKEICYSKFVRVYLSQVALNMGFLPSRKKIVVLQFMQNINKSHLFGLFIRRISTVTRKQRKKGARFVIHFINFWKLHLKPLSFPRSLRHREKGPNEMGLSFEIVRIKCAAFFFSFLDSRFFGQFTWKQKLQFAMANYVLFVYVSKTKLFACID